MSKAVVIYALSNGFTQYTPGAKAYSLVNLWLLLHADLCTTLGALFVLREQLKMEKSHERDWLAGNWCRRRHRMWRNRRRRWPQGLIDAAARKPGHCAGFFCVCQVGARSFSKGVRVRPLISGKRKTTKGGLKVTARGLWHFEAGFIIATKVLLSDTYGDILSPQTILSIV